MLKEGTKEFLEALTVKPYRFTKRDMLPLIEDLSEEQQERLPRNVIFIEVEEFQCFGKTAKRHRLYTLGNKNSLVWNKGEKRWA